MEWHVTHPFYSYRNNLCIFIDIFICRLYYVIRIGFGNVHGALSITSAIHFWKELENKSVIIMMMFHFGKQDISWLFLFKSFKIFVLKSKFLFILFGLSLYQHVGSTLQKAPTYNRYFNDLKETTLWK